MQAACILAATRTTLGKAPRGMFRNARLASRYTTLYGVMHGSGAFQVSFESNVYCFERIKSHNFKATRGTVYMKFISLGKTITLNLLVALATIYSPGTQASEPPKDGLWRANVGLAMTMATGNTQSQSMSLSADATRRTARDKWSLNAQGLGTRSRSNGLTSTTANQWTAGGRYDHNVSKRVFGFAGLDFSRDLIRQLKLGRVISSGLGYHLVNKTQNQWDVFGGVSYRSDQYVNPGVMVRNQLRTTFSSPEAMVGEDSTNTLTRSTAFNQRFTVSHGLSRDGGYHATFDVGLSVAINQTMSLKVSVQDKYDSLAEAPIKRNDMLFLTGVNVKFGG